jgi:hypothetical protein
LKNQFQDALVQYAEEVATAQRVPIPEVQERGPEILGLLEAHSNKLLAARLLRQAVQTDGKCTDHFFEMFGDKINAAETLQKDPMIVVNLFSRLLAERKIGGLRWLKEILARDPKLLNSFDPDSVEDFCSRLSDELTTPKNDDAHPVIGQIAEILGISKHEATRDT